jgi:high-affinity nickel permease
MHSRGINVFSVWWRWEVLAEQVEHSSLWRLLQVLFDLGAIFGIGNGTANEIQIVGVSGVVLDVFELNTLTVPAAPGRGG